MRSVFLPVFACIYLCSGLSAIAQTQQDPAKTKDDPKSKAGIILEKKPNSSPESEPGFKGTQPSAVRESILEKSPPRKGLGQLDIPAIQMTGKPQVLEPTLCSERGQILGVKKSCSRTDVTVGAVSVSRGLVGFETRFDAAHGGNLLGFGIGKVGPHTLLFLELSNKTTRNFGIEGSVKVINEIGYSKNQVALGVGRDTGFSHSSISSLFGNRKESSSEQSWDYVAIELEHVKTLLSGRVVLTGQSAGGLIANPKEQVSEDLFFQSKFQTKIQIRKERPWYFSTSAVYDRSPYWVHNKSESVDPKLTLRLGLSFVPGF